MEQDTLNRNATHDLIASDRVEGTAVYNRDGEKLGSIAHFMVSKRGGKVSYAVMSFGGFLGMGTEEYTLPWEKLEYDTEKGGYVVDVTKEQLGDAPKYSRSDDYDRTYYERVSGYYGYPTPMW
jgi:PRC-barrel domain